ncbi:uroporphyrinogen-III C-methyltransferase [Naumannella halotolerans]|uniref:uroporphyrinogen-III C-methyltransferase n=1 Tax=Naumannella halotolerans TaxID=993414 RepID=UPI00370D15E0
MSYPLMLQLRDRRTLVVGGGSVATRRALALVDAGSRVEVVSPRISPELSEQVAAGRVFWRPETYRSGLLQASAADRVWLVHAATDDPAVNAQIAEEAEQTGVFCIRADDHSGGSARVPAVAVGNGPAEGLTVAVSGDADPRRAVAVRDAIDAGLAAGTLPVRRVRPVRGTGTDSSTSLAAGEESTGDRAPGWVALVGGGPGQADLITVRGRQLLAAADVVVADRLGPRELLAELPAEVEVIDVGKTPGNHPVPQSEINQILVDQARAGHNVVRLKGGDPFVLGRGGEEALHCAEHGVVVEVVPGISSAIAVPAAAGIPVTHRGVTASFVVASAHRGADDAIQALRDAPDDATLVLLMGVTMLPQTAQALIDSGRSPDTPMAMIERGWTPQQRTTVSTLEKAPLIAEQEDVRAPAVIVIGDVVSLRDRLGDLA